MTLIRAVAIGLLFGSLGVLIFDPRGEGLNHVRLAALMGLLVGQLLTVPLCLVGGLVRTYAPKRRLAVPYDFPMGALLLACGVLVMTQARIVANWLSIEPTPGGVGDRDGETSIALLAGLSGCLMALAGLALLANAFWTSAQLRREQPSTAAPQSQGPSKRCRHQETGTC
ncbi:hypothetical protein ACFW2D_12760 [Streptomyces sp. NPDC058914]|uniref:hypothetical protein n=1 Tax=Streptomyces sp. NPDC058914 TaxID=3346671 RepID=UPI0036ADF7D1